MFRTHHWLRISIACLGLVASGIVSAQTLTVGMKPPAIKVGKWIKGTEVKEFKPGTVYVVEFWATWCGPCKESIPHLTELQKKYKDQLTVIGVDCMEQEWWIADLFVKNMGDKMAYTVAQDISSGPDAQFMANNWMKPSGAGGIPTAFIIGKDGKLKFIGHPMQMDDPLKKEIEAKYEAPAPPPSSSMTTDDKLALLEKSLKEGKKELFAQYAEHLVDGVEKENAAVLNRVAWLLVCPDRKLNNSFGYSNIPAIASDFDRKPFFALALRASLKAVELTKHKNGSYLDTLSWAYYQTGDSEKAAQTELKAATVVPPHGLGVLTAEFYRNVAEFFEKS